MSLKAAAIEAAHLIDRLERLARLSDSDLNPAQWEALRYLDRANRFSRTPAALADYLASTRGTVSQTLIALEGKGYVDRQQNARDGRSIDVALTALGRRALAHDPLMLLAKDIQDAAGGHLEQLLENLRDTLKSAIGRNNGKAFGVCKTCCHFRSDVRPGARSPNWCALLEAPLSDADSLAICVEHVAAE